MIKEFKQFISKGNVVDLAVGVVIGGAFGKIVSSLVDNIIMPIVGLLIGGVDFSGLSISIKDANIQYGLFVQNVVDFLIVAFCIFIVIRSINKFNQRIEKKLKKEKKEEEPTAPKKSEDILLLEEIRNLLKENKKSTKNK